MMEDHVMDLFGEHFEEWMDNNGVISGGFCSWSETPSLPEDHPEHASSLEANLESAEVAIELITSDGEKVTITLSSGIVVEKSDNFPVKLMDELKEMALKGPSKVHLSEG